MRPEGDAGECRRAGEIGDSCPPRYGRRVAHREALLRRPCHNGPIVPGIVFERRVTDARIEFAGGGIGEAVPPEGALIEQRRGHKNGRRQPTAYKLRDAQRYGAGVRVIEGDDDLWPLGLARWRLVEGLQGDHIGMLLYRIQLRGKLGQWQMQRAIAHRCRPGGDDVVIRQNEPPPAQAVHCHAVSQQRGQGRFHHALDHGCLMITGSSGRWAVRDGSPPPPANDARSWGPTRSAHHRERGSSRALVLPDTTRAERPASPTAA